MWRTPNPRPPAWDATHGGVEVQIVSTRTRGLFGPLGPSEQESGDGRSRAAA